MTDRPSHGDRASTRSVSVANHRPRSFEGWASALADAAFASMPTSEVRVYLDTPDGFALATARPRRLVADAASSETEDREVLEAIVEAGLPALIDHELPGGHVARPAARSEIAVPIADASGVLVGVLDLRHARVGAYRIEDLDRLSELAASAGATYPDAAPRSGSIPRASQPAAARASTHPSEMPAT